MPFRLKVLFSICTVTALTGTAAWAQVNRALWADPASALAGGRQAGSAVMQAPLVAGHKKSSPTGRLATPGSSGLNFDAAVSYSSGGDGGNSIAIADLNGDVYPDLGLVSYCASGSGCANGSVAVRLGNGNGTFKLPVSYASGGQFADSVAVADLGNGHLDLIVGNCGSVLGNICVGTNGGVGVLWGNGDGTFQTAVPYAATFGVAAVAAADVNGDGNKDVLIATNCGSGSPITYSGCVGVLLGDGEGNLAATAVTYGSGGYSPGAIAVGDLNGDSKLDVSGRALRRRHWTAAAVKVMLACWWGMGTDHSSQESSTIRLGFIPMEWRSRI